MKRVQAVWLKGSSCPHSRHCALWSLLSLPSRNLDTPALAKVLLCGTSILAVAIWLRVGKDGREILSPGDATINPYIAVNILIAVGAIIMILGFLGCFGAMKENQFMLVLFFIGLILILLLQVVAGILGATNKSKTERALNETLQTNVHLLSATNENGKLFQEAFSEIQEELKCCGLINGASDWGNNFQYYYKSCECPSASDSSCTMYDGKTIYKQSCFSLLRGLFSRRLSIVIGLAFGLAAVEVLGLIFSLVLYCQIRKK
ncbi:tetraspanin-8 isoform X4 [Balaenoptera ricei]|uniref:tetraspanin-8 isoform X4 n=1 Tax=Balaenoptera ricei TaxID=2746895 RepID=UPI0028BE3038|nr:tetraspanin-8 isoform X4 [Balaenoptera ricei]XP_059792492.1 tetraspanin-8 isoform X4 [Balaenoptera ricei]